MNLKSSVRGLRERGDINVHVEAGRGGRCRNWRCDATFYSACVMCVRVFMCVLSFSLPSAKVDGRRIKIFRERGGAG